MSGIAPAEPPDDLEQVLFRFRLYAATGEIGTFATSIGVWEPGETWDLPDGRCFRIVSVAVVAGSDIDGIFQVEPIDRPRPTTKGDDPCP